MNNIDIFCKKYAPTILAVIGCAGVFGTAFVAAKNEEKANNEIKNIESQRLNDSMESGDTYYMMSKKEQLLIKAKFHISTALIGFGTCACIIGSNGLSRKQNIELISAYGLVSESYRDYRDKLVEFHGKDEDQRIIDSIAAEKSNPPHIYADTFMSAASLDAENISCDDKERLFYDKYSRRFFKSTYSTVLQAQYHLNRNFCLGDTPTVNDFYTFLGIPTIDGGDEVAWNMAEGYGWIDFDNRQVTAKNGVPYVSISFIFDPNTSWQEDL